MKNTVAQIRKREGLTQLELAKISQVARCDIAKIESGRYPIYPSWRHRLAEALQVDEGELFFQEFQTAGKS